MADSVTEERFLSMLDDAPADDTTRLVYADWLEAEGERDRAGFLRLVVKLANPNVHRKKAPVLLARLRRLAASSEPAWRARVTNLRIAKCDAQVTLRFFKCPMLWTSLQRTPDPLVRHCASCERSVYYCSSLDEVRAHGKAGDCVAFDPAFRPVDASWAYDGDSRDDPQFEIGEIAR